MFSALPSDFCYIHSLLYITYQYYVYTAYKCEKCNKERKQQTLTIKPYMEPLGAT